MNPYARLAFAKGLHARLGAGADSVLAHLREELLLSTDFQQAADTLQSDNVPHSTNAYLLRPTFPLDPCHLSS